MRLLAALEHPGIARFLDGGQSADGTWYLALEYVEGQDLIRFAEDRQLDIRERVRLFLQVLAAVEYAHQRQVVHRDLKPGNILVDDAGRAHLLDFGISKLVAEPDDAAGLAADPGAFARDIGATQTELRLLTPAYASPEQIRGGPVGTASDIYSLGVVFYELLAGVHPYGGERSSRHELELAALAGHPEPPSTAARHRPRCWPARGRNEIAALRSPGAARSRTETAAVAAARWREASTPVSGLRRAGSPA